MSKALVAAGVCCAAVLSGGCGNTGFKDDGIPPSDKASAASANAMAVSVGGDYDKLTADQKRQFLQLTGVGEKQARTMMQLMAHPPVRAGAGTGSPGVGGPPRGPHPPGSGG
jgi:hypothetical protein